MPEPAHLEPEQLESTMVHRNSIILSMSRHHRAQPFALLRDGSVQASPEFDFHLAQLGLQPFTYRLPQYRKPPAARLPTDMREAKKVEGFGLPVSTPLPVLVRVGTEFQEAGLLGMQLQLELPKTLGQFLPAALGIRLVLEPEHEVSRPGESHPQALAEPYMNVSAHTAPVIQPSA